MQEIHAMMYIDNEVLEKMIMTIVEGFDRIEKKLDRMGRVKEFLNGDELLDNYDIAKLLNVSLRKMCIRDRFVLLSGENVAVREDGTFFAFKKNTFIYGANLDVYPVERFD